MKTLLSVLSLFFLICNVSTAQSPAPFVPDANTVALWHFNESSGSFVADTSAYHNNGAATGTMIIPGRFGNARFFNGAGDYIYVGDPLNGSLDFSNSQSFTIDAWFKTTSFANQQILRKGLAPVQGYELKTLDGRVVAIVGNREDGTPPDTLLWITSTNRYNDGTWHLATMVRDRIQRKLFLYVDGVQAAQPVNDPIQFSLANDRPFTIGRWENPTMPIYFNGSIDEVRISNIARNAPPIMSDTVALWHYNETSGNNVFDSSPYRNDGTAYGTTIVPGRFGNARSFSGSYNYVFVPYPGTISLNFSTTQSFTIQVWFKTTQSDTGEMIRRGLAPTPGFAIRILDGHVQGITGYQEPYLRITSTRSNYNDGQWHVATLIRDRVQGKVFLYVDGVQAAIPLNDNVQNAIANDRPLTMGCWENFVRPTFYRGLLDEVAIFKGARHPVPINAPAIAVSPVELNFGNVVVGNTAQDQIAITNVGFRDTLVVQPIGSNNPVFSAVLGSSRIPPGISQVVPVLYAPTAVRVDTGSLTVNSNDPNRPTLRVQLSGRGFTLRPSPVITSIRDIPDDQGKQVRVTWYRSSLDSTSGPNRVTQYDLWRKVVGSVDLWDFIVTVPAVQFSQYAYVAPTLRDSNQAGIRWTVFKVSARSISAQTYFSAPDSGYSADNIPPHRPTNLVALVGSGHVEISWDQPPDPDIELFAVYRSDAPNFTPSESNRIGSPHTNLFADFNVTGSSHWYYRIAALDSSGNQSAYSDELSVIVTDVGQGQSKPKVFALHQNYPNPFNPSSRIRYDLPQVGHVMIRIFDLLGREIATLIDEFRQSGEHEVSWNANGFASGVYLCRMQVGTFNETKKMVLMR